MSEPVQHSAQPTRRAAVGMVGASSLAAATQLASGRKRRRQASTYQFIRRTGPARSIAYLNGAVVAVFTDNARSVAVVGASRTFSEPAVTAQVRQTSWIRHAPYTWTAASSTASWVAPWLDQQRANGYPDLLSMAMEYTAGRPIINDSNGIRYTGDASYGPIGDNGRSVGGDIQDYTGASWTFADGVTRTARADYLGCIDCSGFVRTVLGRRMHYPLLSGYTAGPGLPRRARDMAAFAPGAVVLPDTGARPTALEVLLPGDLLFFSTNGDGIINHCAFYLGVDTTGKKRFLSSRKTVDGPTMGDVAGASILDGTGYYAAGLRSARRI